MRVAFVNQDQLLKNLKHLGFLPRTVFDVGVATGTPWLYSAFPDSYFYLFEPVQSFDGRIAEILKSVRGEHVKLALGAEPGRLNFYIPKDAGKHQIATACFTAREVPSETLHDIEVTTLDAFAGGRAIDGPILLKTDVQGLDLQVAKGAEQLLPRIDVVICEVPLYGPWGGGNDFKDYIDFYYSKGFIFYDVVEPLRRPDDDRLHSIDICFVNGRSPIGARNLYTSGKDTLLKSRQYYGRNN